MLVVDQLFLTSWPFAFFPPDCIETPSLCLVDLKSRVFAEFQPAPSHTP